MKTTEDEVTDIQLIQIQGRVDIVESYWVSPRVLFGLRVIFALNVWGFMVWRLNVEQVYYFTFLTQLSWIGLGLYFTLASTLSYLYVFKGQTISSPYITIPYDILWTCQNVYSWIVPVIFWGLLFVYISYLGEPEEFGRVYDHAADLIFTMIELFLCKVKLPFAYSTYSLVVLILYMSYLYVLRYAAGMSFPYIFMDWWFDIAVDVYAIPRLLLAILIHYAFFVIPWSIVQFRDYLANQRNQGRVQPIP